MNLNLFIAKKVGGNGTISCVSVAISMLVMFVAISISDGFRKEIGEKVVGFSGEILFTVPGQEFSSYKYPLDSRLSYLPDVEAIQDVESIQAVAYTPGMAKTDDDVHGILLKGVDSTYSPDFFAKYLCEGSLPSFTGRSPSNEVMISKRLADMMGYKAGDKMTVYFVGDNIRVRRFTITGMYSIQLDDIDEKLVLTDIRHVRRLNGWENYEASCLEVFLKGEADAMDLGRRMKVASAIDKIIMDSPNDDDTPVIVSQIDDIYWHLFDWLQLVDLNVVVVLALMIIVAGFNMVSGLLIILFENISMIGLLKSLGMRTKAICGVFLYKASAIVLKGMVIGDVLALALTVSQKWFKIISLNPQNYFVDHIPISIDPVKMVIMNVAAFVVMMLIMLIPSAFISKVSPDKTIKVS